VHEAGYRAGVRETATTALFVTSEYSGSIIVYLFRLPDGKVVEVEYHLSHKRPEELREGSSYALVWRTDHAMVFDSPKIAA